MPTATGVHGMNYAPDRSPANRSSSGSGDPVVSAILMKYS
jgi:hypothetical protein